MAPGQRLSTTQNRESGVSSHEVFPTGAQSCRGGRGQLTHQRRLWRQGGKCTAILHRSRLIIRDIISSGLIRVVISLECFIEITPTHLSAQFLPLSTQNSTNDYVTLSKLGNYVRTKSVSYCDIEDSLGTSKKVVRIGTTVCGG